VDADEPPEQVALAVLPDPRFERFPQWLEKVVGDSADLKIPNGHYAHVVDAIEMGYAPRAGDWVVVERRSDQGGKRERTIKQVELGPRGQVRLFPAPRTPGGKNPSSWRRASPTPRAQRSRSSASSSAPITPTSDHEL
jgi:hypothetical protein